jgi:gephyrin
LITRKTSGITHLLLSSSLNITPFAALSRPITGIRNETMIITLPGSPKACKENIQAVLKVLPHALDLLLDRKAPSKKLHEKIQQQVGDVDVDKSAAVAVGRGGHTCTHKHALTGHESQTGQSASLDTPGKNKSMQSTNFFG